MTHSIREARTGELQQLLDVHRAAFGQTDEANLVRDLLDDPTAQPCLSLVATQGQQVIGHILFTAIRIEGSGLIASILCPLAVLPQLHRQGIGKALIETGLQHLRTQGCDLVFVLGDPAYYGQFGFREADFDRLPTPQPIPDHYRPGWMVQSISDKSVDAESRRLVCADALNRPEFWSDGP